MQAVRRRDLHSQYVSARWGIQVQVSEEVPHGNHRLPLLVTCGVGQ